ncbi:hypothetical protein [Solibacillus sp. CAU 1738]|uniref:hypothetical protein n=1 Tax=Solibacillus sp. CAU 1738 TaxID=3140363 RepID=UPI0032608D5F
MSTVSKQLKTEIAIGIISPQSLIIQIREVLQDFPNLKPHFLIANFDVDFYESIENLMSKVEVLMFTDSYTYELAKKHINFSIPVHQMPSISNGLYRALLKVLKNYDATYLSVDTIEEKYLKRVLAELQHPNMNYSIFNTNNAVPIDDIIKHHIDCNELQQAYVVTAIPTVAEQLRAQNIAVEFIIPTEQDMIVAFERALLSTDARRNKETQIVYGLIHLHNKDQLQACTQTPHLLDNKITQTLQQYIQTLDGHLIHLQNGHFAFITMRGIFERETRGYKYMPLVQLLQEAYGLTVSLGIGFGLTASESGTHAKQALQQSIELAGNVCYIVREDNSVIGPVDMSTQANYERYDLVVTDHESLQRAEKAGMSATYMSKLMARIAKHKKIDYTAQELADTLHMTLRSANRILLKWMDADLVEIIGEEKVAYKGRPRRIYRLKFFNDFMN